MRTIMMTSGLVLALGIGTAIAADEFGTADEAEAMIHEAAAAIEADKDAALAAFNAGEDPFRAKDLYVFCGGEDGLFSAHGANGDLIGQSMRDLEDKAGEPLGEKLYAVGEGEVEVVEYMWPRPGESEPSPKASYVTKVADQTCGVGYYQ